MGAGPTAVPTGDPLDQARHLYRQRAWADAFQAFSGADRQRPLEAEDLELLAMAAYLVGGDEDYLRALERAHYAHLQAGPRCACRPLRVLARLSPAHAQ